MPTGAETKRYGRRGFRQSTEIIIEGIYIRGGRNVD